MKRVLMAFLFAMGLFSILFAELPVNDKGRSPFVEIVKELRESVVHIRVEAQIETNLRSQGPWSDDFFKYFFPQLPESRESVSMGSGFIFEQKGEEVFIMTNAHVIENGDKGTITVTLADKAKYQAEIIGTDTLSDIAVIKIEVDRNEKVVVADLGDSDDLEIGDWAIAIGNPFGGLGLDRTVTVGVISATNRSDLNFGKDSPVYQDYIQTDAAINPGNSGGPLINIYGEVIGVNAAITSPAGGNVGIGFAIPVNLARKVSNDLMKDGRVIRAYLGILPQQMTSELAKAMKMDRIYGVLVAKVEQETPAEKAGLKEGDVIIEVDGKEVPDVSRFRIMIADGGVGQRIKMKVIRKGETKDLTAILEEKTDEIVSTGRTSQTVDDIGLEVQSLDSEFAANLQDKPDFGVIVSNVSQGTPASKAGFSRGDIIQQINGKEIKTVKDFNNAISEARKEREKDDEKIVLMHVLKRNGAYQFVTLQLD
ncbi:MAG: Do family serine endopeptidase [Candidatus Cloacimonetes bacterium]|nr:Do family serine endopeptidase [Candidatus Cloacimonadota bacterium]